MIMRFWHHKVDYIKNIFVIDFLIKISLEQGVKFEFSALLRFLTGFQHDLGLMFST